MSQPASSDSLDSSKEEESAASGSEPTTKQQGADLLTPKMQMTQCKKIKVQLQWIQHSITLTE